MDRNPYKSPKSEISGPLLNVPPSLPQWRASAIFAYLSWAVAAVFLGLAIYIILSDRLTFSDKCPIACWAIINLTTWIATASTIRRGRPLRTLLCLGCNVLAFLVGTIDKYYSHVLINL